jgi:hypothetical protein
MTADEWEHASEPHALLAYLEQSGRASPRKLRLFAVACARRLSPWTDPLGRVAVEIAEQFADGVASAEAMRAARLACHGAGGNAAWYPAASNPAIAAHNAARSAQSAASQIGSSEAAKLLSQAQLLREVFGNPFLPAAFDRAWLQGDSIAQLAQAIYDDGSFERMPEVADAMRKAGCNHSAILTHCVQAEPHVRGCWLLDLILQRS